VSISETTSKEGISSLREQLVHVAFTSAANRRMLAGRGAREARMDLAHLALAVDENGRGTRRRNDPAWAVFFEASSLSEMPAISVVYSMP